MSLMLMPRLFIRVSEIERSKIDTPNVDGTKVDVPKVDALIVNAPKVDALIVNAPIVDALIVDAPIVNALKVDRPRVDAFVIKTIHFLLVDFYCLQTMDSIVPSTILSRDTLPMTITCQTFVTLIIPAWDIG